MSFAPPFERAFRPEFWQTTNGLLDNLVAYWPGNEASGNLLDAHINGYSLSDTNGVTTAAGLVYPTARNYARASLQAHVGTDLALLEYGDFDFSFASWVWLDSNITAGSTICFGAFDDNVRCWGLFVSGGASPYLYATLWNSADAARSAFDFSGPLTFSAWHSLILTYTAATDTIAVYKNASAGGTQTMTVGFKAKTASSAFRIGYSLWGSTDRAWDGRIGPTAFWRGALSTVQRAAWHNGGAGLIYGVL